MKLPLGYFFLILENKMDGDGHSKPKKIAQLPGYQGNIYQTKLLMLYLLRGLKNNQKFELGTEIEEAKKFDDLVFKYEKFVDGKDRDHFVILQSKHVNTKITYSDIFTDTNGDFGLVKYFNAFNNAKNEKLFKDNVIEHAIIYTNANIDIFRKIPKKDVYLGKFEKIDNMINNITDKITAHQYSILSLCKSEGGKFYQFKSDLVLQALKALLFDSIYRIIAQKLINALNNNKKNRLRADDEILKYYDYLLVTEVIDLNTKTLRQGFIDEVGNDTGRRKLRSVMNEVANNDKIKLNTIIKNVLSINKNFGNEGTQQNWPNDADIEFFFKTFVFATGQPDGDRLGKIILSELDDQYNAYDADFIYGYLANEIIDWMFHGNFGYDKSKSTSECRFISSQDANEFLKKTKRKFNKIMLKGPTTQYDNYFKEYVIEFDDKKLKNDIEAFLSSDTHPRILNIVGEHIIISSIKLYKELIKKELKEFIYVKLSFLNNNIIDAFESEINDHLLVIELDVDKTKCNDWMEMISEIIETIQSNNKKKLIIISNQKDVLENILQRLLLVDTKFDEIYDDANKLKNLTENSQIYFLNKSIKFQGCHVKLSNLIVNDNLKNLINGEVLFKILENEDIEIGKPVEGLKEEKTLYVNRTFTCEIKNNENVYLLCGINEEDLCSEYRNLEVIEKSESMTIRENDIFERAIKDNISMNIYLLRKTFNAFILLKTSKAPFEISNLKNTLNYDRNGCEVNLISAIAGMGKSTLFTNLSEKIKEYNPSSWVIKINLNTVSSKLKKMNDQVMEFKDTVDFLHHAANLQFKLDKTIFEHHLQMGNVMLYLDAFDEICPSYKQIVLKIIEELKKNTKIKKICVSTRPHDSILKDLKGSITNIPLKHYNIEPFTLDDQKKYLENYWKLSTKFNEKRFEIFVQELFKLLIEKINDRRYEFLGVALHTNMIAVALKDSFDEFQKSDSPKIDDQRQKLTKMLQLSELYGKFVKNKFVVYWLNRNFGNFDTNAAIKLAEREENSFVNRSKTLALDSLFDEKQLVKFLTQEDLDNLTKCKIEMKENGDELGIVTQVIDDKPHFIHRTFAEYFTAVFLLEVWKKQDEKSMKIIEYFLKNMINQEHAVILQFMNSLLNFENLKQENDYQKIIKELNGRELYFVTKNNWHNIAIWLLTNRIKLDYEEDNTNVLHLTCLYQDSENKNDLLRLILEELKTEKIMIPFIKKKDKYGNTPLNVAVKYGRLLNVICILKTYVEEKILVDAFIDENKKGENIFHLAAYKKCDDDTFIYLLKFASSDPVKFKNYLLKTNEEGETPLTVAAADGQLNKLKAVFDSNIDSEFVDSVYDNVNQNGENIFHGAATNYCDDDTFIYLLKFASRDPVKLKNYLLKTNEWGQTPLTEAAAHGQLNKLKIVFDSNGDSDITDSIFDNVNRNEENVFHRAAHKKCDDNTFIYLLKFASSDPVKFKNYLLKTNKRGETPVTVAASEGQLNKVKAVLESNVDSEYVDSVFENVNRKGGNIFHRAAINYCDDNTFVYLLKIANRDPVKFKNYLLKINKEGETPLSVAAADGQLKKVRAVLESDVDSEFVDSIFDNVNLNGGNVFHRVATNYCNDDTYIYLLKFASSDPVKFKNYLLKTNEHGETPLTMAVGYGQLNKLKAVLDSNINSDITDSLFDNVNRNGGNVFHGAATNYCDDDTFIYLLEFASRDPVKLKNYLLKTNECGETPLTEAAAYGQLNKVKAILESNVDTEILDSVYDNVNQNGGNVFHRAATNYCDDDTFIYLLKFANSDPVKFKNYLLKTNEWGYTPLAVAAMWGQLNKVKAILDSNIDSDITDSFFINMNEYKDNYHFVNNNLKYDTFIYLLKIASCDPMKLKNYLLKPDNSSITPLIVAAKKLELNKLKALLDSNIDTEIVDIIFCKLKKCDSFL